MSRSHAAALLAALAAATVCDARGPGVVVSDELPGYPRVVAEDEVILTVVPYVAAKDVRPVQVAVYKPIGPSGPISTGGRGYIWAQSGVLGRVVRRVPPWEYEMAEEGANFFPNYEVTVLEGANSGTRGIVSRRNLKTLPPR